MEIWEGKDILGAVNAPHQFSHENGIQVTYIAPEYAEGVLKIGPNSVNPHGFVHGGALSTLADTVGGCCACAKGGSCVSATCSMEFLRPAQGTYITCKATPTKRGRTLSVIQVQLRDDSDALVATGTYTFFMFPDKNIR